MSEGEQYLPAGQLGGALGIRQVSYQPDRHDLAVKDAKLA